MPIHQKIEEKILATDKKLKEIAIFLELLEREYDKALENLELTPQRIEDFAHEFTPEVIEEIEAQEKIYDEELEIKLSQIQNPFTIQKKASERAAIQQNWVFIR